MDAPESSPLKAFEDFLGRLFRVSKQELGEALKAEKRIAKSVAPEASDEVIE